MLAPQIVSARFYKVLVWALGFLSVVLLSLLAYSYLRFIELRGEIRYANDIVWRFEQDRDSAYKGSLTNAADMLWSLHYPSFDWPGHPEPFHGAVARLVERQRRGCVRDVISYLRAKTGNDLGDNLEVWILTYGSDNARDGLTAMREPDARDTTVSVAKTVQRTGASRSAQATNQTSPAAGSDR